MQSRCRFPVRFLALFLSPSDSVPVCLEGCGVYFPARFVQVFRVKPPSPELTAACPCPPRPTLAALSPPRVLVPASASLTVFLAPLITLLASHCPQISKYVHLCPRTATLHLPSSDPLPHHLSTLLTHPPSCSPAPPRPALGGAGNKLGSSDGEGHDRRRHVNLSCPLI
ncbi:hypothetical protein E2C01_027560 [Portunus trituberculatus]|uniref:Uncharacterized protein n=1 Tax=Portunus trituberculatus TaxID=210409 RepID=A0A5B7EI68_PORTR|nr:hypothetical protein [Portunus trituberculatus]